MPALKGRRNISFYLGISPSTLDRWRLKYVVPVFSDTGSVYTTTDALTDWLRAMSRARKREKRARRTIKRIMRGEDTSNAALPPA